MLDNIEHYPQVFLFLTSSKFPFSFPVLISNSTIESYPYTISESPTNEKSLK